MCELKELRLILQDLGSERDDLKRKNERLIDELNTLREDMDAIRETCINKKETVAIMEAEYRQMQKDYNEMRDKCVRERNQRKKLCEEFAILEDENDRLRHCLDQAYKNNAKLKTCCKQNSTRQTGLEELRAAQLCKTALERENHALREKLKLVRSKPKSKLGMPRLKQRPVTVYNVRTNQHATCNLEQKLAKLEHENRHLARQIADIQTRARSRDVSAPKRRMRSYPFRSSSAYRSPQRRHVRCVYDKPRARRAVSSPDCYAPEVWKAAPGEEKYSSEEQMNSVSFQSIPQKHRLPTRVGASCGRSRSPQCRSNSPQCRSNSPHYRSNSPQCRLRSPHCRSNSPHCRPRSPQREETSRSYSKSRGRDKSRGQDLRQDACVQSVPLDAPRQRRRRKVIRRRKLTCRIM